jgi:hypothetical protein
MQRDIERTLFLFHPLNCTICGYPIFVHVLSRWTGGDHLNVVWVKLKTLLEDRSQWIYRSFNPFPLRICGNDFSILDSLVLDCLGVEK